MLIALFAVALSCFFNLPADAIAGNFPPLNTPDFAAYRSQFDEDRARLERDPAGFFADGQTGIECGMSREQQKEFVEGSFIRDISWNIPGYVLSKQSWDVETVLPIFDRHEIRVLDGSCSDGMIEGPATVVASFVAIQPRGQFGNRIFRIFEVKLRETCQYRGSIRNGECRRAETATTFLSYLNDNGFLEKDTGYPATGLTIFDYGFYEENRETGPGTSFQIAALPGYFKYETLTRRKQAGSLRYESYLDGDRVIWTYFRRQSDLVLHGPAIWPAPNFTCFEDGKKVERMECPEP
ncbi:MAG: hypothetical protein JJ959_16275 [Nisaea sp.]|uniref:hypothetical protein n=1 Tax=Nisaea sp. TaxID=2024842 RepID=UPI001AFF0FD6|nr:hypothetical protein [Nisaea sp.]MBO6562102.1 hypothetical protein [Nisaea sp.]